MDLGGRSELKDVALQIIGIWFVVSMDSSNTRKGIHFVLSKAGSEFLF
jgi:hypothetical protein